jgi:hypothetical protein
LRAWSLGTDYFYLLMIPAKPGSCGRIVQVGDFQLKSGDHYLYLSLHVRPKLDRRAGWQPPLRTITIFLCAIACLSGIYSSAQSASEKTDAIHGVVMNSVTHEPIPRALVSSPDHRFATLTNSEGRFEFTFAKTEGESAGSADASVPAMARSRLGVRDRPYMLIAVKPGFMPDPDTAAQNIGEGMKDVTITLVPESLIVGTVTLPTAEAPDSISLRIFRWQVQEGRGQWVQSGGARSSSDGQFRFAELSAGTYKLLTEELLDRDPLTFSPVGPLFGYPPVYYQSAPDFASASTIQLSPGQTVQVGLSLVRQPYYSVKVPVMNAPENGLNVRVYANGPRGPGYSLGYNNDEHTIEGMLPNGTYTVEASSYGPNGASGSQTLNVKGGPIDGPAVTMVPNSAIPVSVKEEFTSGDHTGSMSWNINGRNVVVKGPRRYLNVMLESADESGTQGGTSLRMPTRPGDEALVIEGAAAGKYWVRVNSSRGYAASVRSGNIDLLREPLVVGVGGAAAPIEITMRDDTAEISGTVEGVARPSEGAQFAGGREGMTFYSPSRGGPHIYCIPLADSSGQFTEVFVNPDGSFVSQGLAPGEYRLLAFDRVQPELEYRNPEAMQAYESKGPVVRLAGGQKERIQLQIISTKEE